MKPTTLRSVGELVGTLGVLMGLLFVGLELRNSTAVARAETRREVAAQNVDMVMQFTRDDNLLRLWLEAWTLDFVDGLSAMDRGRLEGIMVAFVLRLESTYLQVEQGLLEESDLAGYGFSHPHFNEPLFTQFWAGYSPELNPDFVQYFEVQNGY